MHERQTETDETFGSQDPGRVASNQNAEEQPDGDGGDKGRGAARWKGKERGETPDGDRKRSDR